MAGKFISEIIKPQIGPIEEVELINKEMINQVYKFMLSRNGVRNLRQYFDDKSKYEGGGIEYGMDLIEIFVGSHMVKHLKWLRR